MTKGREAAKRVRIVLRSGRFLVVWEDAQGGAFVTETHSSHEEATRAALALIEPGITDLVDETGVAPETDLGRKN